jgi:hypothetical protein
MLGTESTCVSASIWSVNTLNIPGCRKMNCYVERAVPVMLRFEEVKNA